MDNTTQRQLIYLLDRIATALEKIAGIQEGEQEGDGNDGNNEENVNDTYNV